MGKGKTGNFRVLPGAPSKGLLEGAEQAFFPRHRMSSSDQARQEQVREGQPRWGRARVQGKKEWRVQEEKGPQGTH